MVYICWPSLFRMLWKLDLRIGFMIKMVESQLEGETESPRLSNRYSWWNDELIMDKFWSSMVSFEPPRNSLFSKQTDDYSRPRSFTLAILGAKESRMVKRSKKATVEVYHWYNISLVPFTISLPCAIRTFYHWNQKSAQIDMSLNHIPFKRMAKSRTPINFGKPIKKTPNDNPWSWFQLTCIKIYDPSTVFLFVLFFKFMLKMVSYVKKYENVFT